MKAKTVMAIMIAAIVLPLAVLAAPTTAAREVKLASFSNIVNNSGCDIEIVQAPAQRVVVEKDFDKIKLEVKKGTLFISAKGSYIFRNNDAEMRITMPAVSSITTTTGDIKLSGNIVTPNLKLIINGAGDVDAKGTIKAGDVKIKITGAGDVDLERVLCNTIGCDVAGAGDVDLKGVVNNATFAVSGAGDIDAKHLEAQTCSLTISGAGDVDFNAKQVVRKNVSGVSSVTNHYGKRLKK